MFVSGEPGIGKSTLVRTFLASAAAPVRAAVAHAQCIELYGDSEPYLPIFEAMQRLGAEIGADKLASYLKSFAPTWLAQMPWLADANQPATTGAGATSQRMLRELAQALEAMSAVRPIVLWVEDLHWSDLSTRDALSFLARRSDPARLLIIGSWRPAEAHARGHPVQAVKEAIALCSQCRELALGFLGLGDVSVYLQRRFALEPAELGELSQFLHARTSGNPLFVVTLADDLVRSGALRTNGTNWQLTRPVSEIGITIPDTVQILIGQQIESLAVDERRVLQIAAVSGAEFSAAAIAATPGLDIQAVEEICDRLVQRQRFITRRGSHDWPDGTVANRYAFVHAMYQEGLGSRVSEARRVEWQGRIAAREEQAYGADARDIAAQLAVRFEVARRYDRSVKYLELAARNALAGNAYIEADRLYGKAIDDAAAGPARRSRQGRAAHAAAAQRRGHRDAGIRDRRDRQGPSPRADARPRPRRPAGRGARAAQHLDDVRGARPAPQGALGSPSRSPTRPSSRPTRRRCCRRTPSSARPASISASSSWRAPISRMRWRSRPTCPTRNGRASPATSPGRCGICGFPDAASRMGQEVAAARPARSRATMASSSPWASPAGYTPSAASCAEAEALVDEWFEMSSEYGLPFWITWSSCLKGLIQSKRGDYEAGLARMQQSVIGYRATGARIGLVHFMTELAETLAGGRRLQPRPRHHRGGARDLRQDRQPLSRRRHASRPGRAADRRQPRRGRRAAAPAFAERGAQPRRAQPGAQDPDHAWRGGRPTG